MRLILECDFRDSGEELEHYLESACDICGKPMARADLHSDDSGDYHERCIAEYHKESAIAAGIPRSVVEGKTKLSDHFSEEYILSQCNKTKE